MTHSNDNNPHGNSFDPQRRRVLTGLAAATAGASGLVPPLSTRAASLPALPSPADSGIDHIVVVMMENRSFDHILGWVPGAEGIQQGLSFTDTAGNTYPTFALSQNPAYGYQGCSWADPDHSYEAGRTDYNNGTMNGFLLPQPAGDQFPIGYYTRSDVPFYSGCADNWTICDHYFTGILSCTLPNRVYMHCGQTDRKTNTLAASALPTIWDSLIANKVPCKYYYSDTPVIALWRSKYFKEFPISYPIRQFVKDFSWNGAPPAVSYLDPYMGLAIGEALGTSWDDHAFADIRNGQAFLNFVYTVLRHSPAWKRTLLVINYDEWGGFYDHISPPTAPVSDTEFAATGNDGRLGIRVPCIAIGPRVRRGHVEKTQFDPNSILNMIAWRFGFEPLGVRTGSTNFAYALDFDNPPNTHAPVFDVPAGPFDLKPPFHPPLFKTANKNAFGGQCAVSSNAAEQAAIERRFEEHFKDIRGLQVLGRQFGAEI
jgi:phospholipase C